MAHIKHHWLVLFVITNLFFIFLFWLAAPHHLPSVVVLLLVVTTFSVMIGYLIDKKQKENRRHAFLAFLRDPEQRLNQDLLQDLRQVFPPSSRDALEKLARVLGEKEQLITDKQLELKNYQQYVETWTHDIKTPLSLAILLLENHKEEMSPYVKKRMEYVQLAISNDVDRMLYYARLQVDHPEYKLTKLSLKECVTEMITDYQSLIMESNVEVRCRLSDEIITSDKKVLLFLLKQLFSNALKYAAKDQGLIEITSWTDETPEQKVHLAIRDNGNGVPQEDLPFLFDKGFTGNHSAQKEATGMGLFLAKKYAEALVIDLSIEPFSTSGKGFGIELIFPTIR
ncbi:MAG: sensor histidine kinase [Bavariicoccus seileri]|uniref:sensor histidine kinase n=1 Tax=Bavariicoccus seileri TaxID=549685 RepID=UPI003F9E8E07